jgi:uncharacterized protein YdbL (DUF1318 family)
MKKIALTLTILAFSAGMAFAAITLDAAKQQGLVGERPDGLVGAVSAASPDVSALVDSTNAGRMAKYNAIAAKNGSPVDQVQALAGKSLIEKTPSGQYIMNAAGSWQQK